MDACVRSASDPATRQVDALGLDVQPRIQADRNTRARRVTKLDGGAHGARARCIRSATATARLRGRSILAAAKAGVGR